MPKFQMCELCERSPARSAHHMVPQEINPHCSGLGMIFVCEECERRIHEAFTNEELAFQYNTLDKLKEALESLQREEREEPKLLWVGQLLLGRAG